MFRPSLKSGEGFLITLLNFYTVTNTDIREQSVVWFKMIYGALPEVLEAGVRRGK